ncbi:FGGY-family carbohydrate kinase [Roseivivax sediminis]|uniref:FGGY-family pentulose kinase n=1 Tax=Roseivivax sediminis TaxID=936889 RepID=A0A1I2DBD7_9RHOB|nr:FGGY-family carbohydrate kinase [Roseivivax sediminis]SFE77846.1 FGGY-family pentulose kinase [Roseivivax sediminis]
MTDDDYYFGIDVGTASVRAGLFSPGGRMVARAVHPITVHDLSGSRAEQSSEEIWQAVAASVREAHANAGNPPVAGIAFDATCSLVLRDRADAPLDLGGGRDIILWYDHRAREEAAACTATGHDLLQTVGGVMSPEMQSPKLMWVKRHRPDLWSRLGGAYDLSEWLAHRATGQGARSLNPLVAKWGWLARAGGLQPDFLEAVGLEDMAARAGIGADIVPPGVAIGGLDEAAARDLGLAPDTPVAAGLVDAFAGALAMLGGLAPEAQGRTAALVAGTSSCIMTLTSEPWRARGVWGPYADAILPGLFVNDGGQSATGALLDDVLGRSPGLSHDEAQRLVAEGLARDGAAFGAEIDILPDVNGNRTPFADPDLGAVVSGLTLDRSRAGTARLYWRSAVGIALGLRQILAHLRQAGQPVEVLNVTGGHARSPLLMQLLADATGCTLNTARDVDGVLLGAAIAAAAPGRGLAEAAREMQPDWQVYRPDPAMRDQLARDYAVFERMQDHRSVIRALKR